MSGFYCIYNIKQQDPSRSSILEYNIAAAILDPGCPNIPRNTKSKKKKEKKKTLRN